MNNKAILLTTGAALVLSVSPALAQSPQTQSNSNIKTRGDTAVYIDRPAHVEEVTRKDVERGLKKVGDRVERATDRITGADVSADASAGLAVTDANVATNASAEQMIGKKVMNASGEPVGNVHDIILGKDGQAQYLIVADGGALSVGDKKAAFGYSAVNGRDAKGGVLTSITEEQINQAKDFSYDADASADAKTQVIAADEASVRDIIGAKVTNPAGKDLGTVKDIALENGNAARLIVAYDQILGLGGKRAGLPYEQLTLVPDQSAKPSFRLNADQAAALSGYKQASK